MTYHPRGDIKCVECGSTDVVGRKLCRPCYNRARNNGTLKRYQLLGPGDVFLGRFTKTGRCWIWNGTINEYGYGIFLLPGERPVRAHRYAYEFFVGKIPRGKIVLHTCDNPPCVNPAHLRIGTKADNNRDTAVRRRHNYGLDHWNGRLAGWQVAAIRRSNEPHATLAERYGVSQPYVSRLKSGQRRV